jgi:hypothetical protein
MGIRLFGSRISPREGLGMTARDKFPERRILLRTREQIDRVLALLPNVPLDADRPLELLIREEVRARKLDQNALLWVGPLKDIAEQAWVDGRQFSAEVWHGYFKAEFLPEQYDEELCKDESYRKWDYDPAGNRVLVGSTTQLTVKGFAQYLEQTYAFGANLGVEFHEAPQRGQ